MCHGASILSEKSERRLVQGGADGTECFVFRGEAGGGHGTEKREEAPALRLGGRTAKIPSLSRAPFTCRAQL